MSFALELYSFASLLAISPGALVNPPLCNPRMLVKPGWLQKLPKAAYLPARRSQLLPKKIINQLTHRNALAACSCAEHLNHIFVDFDLKVPLTQFGNHFHCVKGLWIICGVMGTQNSAASS